MGYKYIIDVWVILLEINFLHGKCKLIIKIKALQLQPSSKWMNEWVDKWMYGWTDGCMGGQMNGLVHRWMHRQTNG